MRNATDLRQKVLQASLALIEEGGLDRLSMREVARKSGVSHQAPYYYFGDREAILAAIAGEGFAKLGQSFQRAVARAGSESAKALEAIGRAYVGFALRHPAYFQAMFRADAVQLDRYPDVRKREDEAFGKLVEEIGIFSRLLVQTFPRHVADVPIPAEVECATRARGPVPHFGPRPVARSTTLRWRVPQTQTCATSTLKSVGL